MNNSITDLENKDRTSRSPQIIGRKTNKVDDDYDTMNLTTSRKDRSNSG